MGKLATLLFIAILALSSLVMVGSAFAQSSTPPAVPEFTVELVDSSYDVPTTYSIDPFIGENITHEGYHVESRTIEIRIKNEVPYGYIAGFYYNIRWKGHFEEEWNLVYLASDGFLSRDSGAETVFSREGDYSSTEGLKVHTFGMSGTFPPESQIDFQVEAMIGECVRQVGGSVFAPWIFSGVTSGWSETQTLTIEEVTTPFPSPEPVPSVEPLLILGAIGIVAVFAGLLLYLKRNFRKETQA